MDDHRNTGPSFRHGVRGRRWPGAVRVTVAAASAAACAVAGVAVGSVLWRAPAPGTEHEPQSARAVVDILHNPPVLFSPGSPVDLDFEMVCPTPVCAAGPVTLDLTDDSGRQSTMEGTVDTAQTVHFEVSADVTARGSFEYSATFDLDDGSHRVWPAAGGAGNAMSMSDADVVALPPVLGHPVDANGTLAVALNWGADAGQVGLDEESQTGPTSFDVSDDGDITVLDTVNSRIQRFSGGTLVAAQDISLPRDFPDIAVEDSGTVDVLAPNGGGSGQAYVTRYRSHGEEAGRIDLPSGRGLQIRRRGDKVQVQDQNSQWVTVVDAGRPVTGDDLVAATDVATSSPDGHVWVKHVSESSVLLQKRSDAGDLEAWRVTSKQWLGPVVLAEPTPWGAVVIQSVYSNDVSTYVALTLHDDGSFVWQVVPYTNFAQMTANSDWRYAGGTLYEARTSEDGYAIYSYPVTEGGLQ
jgi:hypothetical protein